MEKVTVKDLNTRLPPPWPGETTARLQQACEVLRRKLVVLDDDPTGTQTVHNVAVLTEWTVARLAEALSAEATLFYVLTNSRSLAEDKARELNRQIARNLTAASRQVATGFTVISRSDSTLRGHYPAETDALTEALGYTPDATLIIPAFLEGGRYTVDNIHYVEQGRELLPVSATPFALDPYFGFKHADLRSWVEEKTRGKVAADEVASVTLDEIRASGPDGVCQQLVHLEPGAVCVVNALVRRDLEVVALAAAEAEMQGKRFLFRTAASFVPVFAGLPAKPLLEPAELRTANGEGGLIVVGSHVYKSAAQLEYLLTQSSAAPVELRVPRLVDVSTVGQEVARARNEVERLLDRGQDVVLYTSRDVVAGTDAEDGLRISTEVSDGLVQVIRGLRTRLRFLIAKGGITSSDIAVRALNVRQARVLGQLLPGVPVWRLGQESRFPDMPYIVFPGNVGETDALLRAYLACSAAHVQA
jgi:uncharacterized protein YgbK (DUF1537 family)